MCQVLRDYQVEMLERLRQAWSGNENTRQQSVMVQMPTGTGKTYLMAEVVAHPQPLPKGGEPRVLVVAHRIELIEQISQTLDRFGIDHGLIVSGKPIDATKQVQVASIQTLTRRLGHTESTENTDSSLFLRPDGSKRPSCVPLVASDLWSSAAERTLHFSLIIIDEAHHAVAETYRMLWDRWPEARFLGLTATPCRLNGAPFTDLFDTLLQSWSIREFIQKGWLSDLDYVSVRSDSIAVRKVASLNKRGADGDYQTKQAALVLDTEESIEHLYRSYKEFADGKKGIVYAINREHARHIAEYYSERGLRCAVIDSKTPAKERQRIVEGYRNEKIETLPLTPPLEGRGTFRERGTYRERGVPMPGIDILVNVDIFSEGFDVPEVEFIQLARPTLSLSKYLQQVGRGMRVAKGKSEVVVLDQAGLYLMFNLPTSDRNWQSTFLGRTSGKGQMLKQKDIMLYGVGDYKSLSTEKWLVNEQMFRIKSVMGGKNQEKNTQSSLPYENNEAQFALVGNDYNLPTTEFCEEMAESLKATLRTNQKVLVQVPPFIEKAQFIDCLMHQGVVWNEEHLSTEPQLTMVVVKRGSQKGLLRRPLYVCQESLLSDSLTDLAMSYKPSLIIIWDANSARPNVYKNVLQAWPDAKLVGLSLAPCDIRYTPEFRLFDMVVTSQSLKSSVDQGLLKDVEYVAAPLSGLTGVYLDMLSPKAYPEDYVSEKLYHRLVSQESTASLFKAYKEYADNKRGIVYAFNDTHAEAIADYYSRHGISAKVFYGDLPSKPRFPMEDFCSGSLKVLVDVHGMSTDYPLPEVQFVQLAYPTQLLSEYLKMVETRMRVTTDYTEVERIGDSDNKLMVIDHVKMGDTFGLPTDKRDWQQLFAERRVETEREPAKPKNNKSRKNDLTSGHAAVAAKWQQRKERLLNASPVHNDHPDKTVKV